MIRAWTKWRISSAVEDGRPLSAGLARKVRRDPEYQRFYELSVAMAKRLREDAEEIAQYEEQRLQRCEPWAILDKGLVDSPATARPSRRAFVLAVAASAAGLLLVAGICWWPSSSPPAPVPGPQLARRTSDVVELVQAIREIQGKVDRVASRRAPQLRELVARSREALRAPILREAENMAQDARGFVESFSLAIQRTDDGSRISEPNPSVPDAKP